MLVGTRPQSEMVHLTFPKIFYFCASLSKCLWGLIQFRPALEIMDTHTKFLFLSTIIIINIFLFIFV